MARSKYTKYRDIIEKMGFRELDVYRYRDKDVIRIQRLTDGKVFVIELPKHRDEMTLDEFKNFIVSALSKHR